MNSRDISVAEDVLVVSPDIAPGYLADAILAEIMRAESVLLLISGQFSGDDDGQWSDQVMSSALWSVQGHLGILKTLINRGYMTSKTDPALHFQESPHN
ncbi:hypothetical protein ABQX22_03280 [Xanthomonas sp. WHRI 1810A]|jgi:hypothetical protein|uniref:hypothetical protein n=1 Tax=Xanthomonas sp. WHRI 1810A TaxID=3161565 RepID=UPI0032E86FBC